MVPWRSAVLIFCVRLAALVLFSVTLWGQSSPQLFRRPADSAVVNQSLPESNVSGIEVVRSQAVEMNRELLIDSSRLTFNLFADTAFDVIHSRTDQTPDGNTSLWMGTIAGMPRSQVILAVTGDY